MSKAPYLYLLCVNDLDSMGNGKAISHGAHAANQFTYDMSGRCHDDSSMWTMQMDREQDEFQSWVQSARGFGTTISLDMSMREMETVIMVANSMNFAASLVTDPTYPYILHKEYAGLIDHKSLVSADTLKDLAEEGNPNNTPKPIGDDMVLCLREQVTCGYVFGQHADLKPIVGNFPMVK
jgi:hypothetical protein